VGNVNWDTIIEDEAMYKNYMFNIGQNFNLVSTESRNIGSVNTKIPGNDLFLELTLNTILATNPDVADPFALLSGLAGGVSYNPLLVSFLQYDAALIIRNGQVQVVK
jgi:hypothetical protein